MAVFNTFTFDGENSLDYGVYITGEAVYNAPERAVEMVSIPGKNGALALDQGRFENIEVTYPAGTFGAKQTEFAGRMRAFRNMLASRYNYVRLTDSYHPDEYRLGLYKSGLEATPVAMSSAGEFDITFNCKPQRFLTSGEEPEDFVPGQSPVDEQTVTGAIVTFDAEEDTIISDLVADIEPVQDLHGYDKPWAGGNGVNILPLTADNIKSKNGGASSWTNNTKTINGILFTISTDADGNVVNIKANGTATNSTTLSFGSMAFKAGTYVMSDFAGDANIELFLFVQDKGSTKISGRSRSFTIDTDASINVGMYINSGKAVNATFYPMITVGSTTPSMFEPYSNICPISGWDEVKVSRTGTNIWDEEIRYGYYNSSTGNFVSYSDQIANKNPISVKPNTSYYLYIGKVGYGSGIRIVYRDKDLNVISISNNVFTGVISTPPNCYYIDINLYTSYGTTYLNDVSINYPSTDTDYHAYNGNTYTIDLDGTRYGGTLDVTSGVLTVDRQIYRVGDLTWEYNTGGRYISNALSGLKPPADNSTPVSNSISSAFTVAGVNYTPGIVGSYGLSIGLLVSVNAFMGSDADAFKTAYADETFLFELATPITVQLTPTEVKTLLGTNNVWADSGNVTVKYGTNPYLIINPTPFDALPLLKVTGAGVLEIGEYIITITGAADQVIFIDCESMEIYKNTGGIITPASSLVSFSTNEFPKLPSGVSGVSLGTGIAEVEITPRWWII